MEKLERVEKSKTHQSPNHRNPRHLLTLLMAPPLAAPFRGRLLSQLHVPIPYLHLRLSTHSLSDHSDFEADPSDHHPLPPHSDDPSDDLASFLQLLSYANSLTTTRRDALALLRSSTSSPQPTAGLLLRALWELRREPEAAMLALRWGEESGGTPASWHLAIWAAGKARRFDLAWQLVRRMRLQSGTGVTQRAMVIMMERYVAANEVKKALKTFELMEKLKVEADQTVFYALLRALCKNKNIEEAEELLLLKKKFFPLCAEGFNIILDGWCNGMIDVAEAKRVWREMSNCCITPDGTSYAHMISCFSKLGNLFDSLRLYDEMKKRGCTPGLGVYNSLVYVLTRENCMKNAQNIFSRITDAGLEPDVETYNSMILPLCDNNKLDEARTVMEDMRVKGITPTIATFHALLKREGIEETFKLLRRMKEDGCGPNSNTFLMLIDKFFGLIESENALRMWTEMRRYDINPSSAHYMALVRGLVKHGWIPKALEYYDEMKDMGFASDPELDRVFRTFLSANRDHWRGADKKSMVPRRGKHFTMRWSSR